MTKYCSKPGNDDFTFNMFTKAHKHAVGVLNVGSALIFGSLFLFSLFSWIQTDNRVMQKVYYRFIAWLIPMSWVLAVWIMVAAIWAASTQTELWKFYEANWKNMSSDSVLRKAYLKPLWMFLIWVGFTGLFEFVAWYMREKVVNFYRWNDQEWWNYDPADAPGNFPAQLGEFVDY